MTMIIRLQDKQVRHNVAYIKAVLMNDFIVVPAHVGMANK